MKLIGKILTIIPVLMVISMAASAQDVALNTPNDVPKARPIVENPTAPASTEEMTILVKNSCEKGVAIFAGSKEDIRDPRLSTYGGRSTNKVYVKVNDVICLMTAEKKPLACTSVKPGMTTAEVNTAGNGITGR